MIFHGVCFGIIDPFNPPALQEELLEFVDAGGKSVVLSLQCGGNGLRHAFLLPIDILKVLCGLRHMLCEGLSNIGKLCFCGSGKLLMCSLQL